MKRCGLLPLVLGQVLLAGLLAGPVRAQDAAPDTADGGSVIDTREAWERVSRARDAAAEDRHGEAAADYLEALANDARLVPLVASELAYQKLWREDAGKAVFYFRRYLARHPDGENREVRKALALALSWDGRQPAAIALYRELVAEDPADGGARVGLGRTLMWDNRLHEGFTVLRGVEDEFPRTDPAGRESRWDSDDLDIYRVGLNGAVTVFGNKLLQIMPRWSGYRMPDRPDIDAWRLAAGFVSALSHRWSVHAYGWVDRFDGRAPLFGQPEKLAWTRPGGDLWFTWLATPRLRLDFGGTSQPVETFFALANEIGYDQGNLSADYRLARRWKLTAAGELADYSDGNEKRKGTLRLTWRREGRWEIHAGPVFTYMDFARAYPGGYWSPDWVRNGSLEATVKTRLEHWTFRLNGSIGSEKELGSGAITVGGASLRVGWRFRPAWLAAVEGGYSKSSFATASGYSRTFGNVSVRAFF
jgi:tetratricopeptide (TPR) repeat protein